jgi:hypothetical protein
MNKNLEELAKQAWVWANNQIDVPEPQIVRFQKKFAELIIKECARISDESDDTWTGQGAASADAFKTYFGVK